MLLCRMATQPQIEFCKKWLADISADLNLAFSNLRVVSRNRAVAKLAWEEADTPEGAQDPKPAKQSYVELTVEEALLQQNKSRLEGRRDHLEQHLDKLLGPRESTPLLQSCC